MNKVGKWHDPSKSDWWWCGCTNHAPTLHPAVEFRCEYCGYICPESMTTQARLDRIELKLREIQEAIHLIGVPVQFSDFEVMQLKKRFDKLNGPRQ